MTDNEIANRVEDIVKNRRGEFPLDHYFCLDDLHFVAINSEEFFAVTQVSNGWMATGYFGRGVGYGETISDSVKDAITNYRTYLKG